MWYVSSNFNEIFCSSAGSLLQLHVIITYTVPDGEIIILLDALVLFRYLIRLRYGRRICDVYIIINTARGCNSINSYSRVGDAVTGGDRD